MIACATLGKTFSSKLSIYSHHFYMKGSLKSMCFFRDRVS